jgi:hypothetical protein
MLHNHSQRRGVAMIVVVTMLALFAIVALGFVFYAESQSTVARISREAQWSPAADVDPEQLASYFLGQLIYDTTDVYSALRSHGLTTSIYGYGGGNHIPFNGVGRGVSYSQPIDYTQYSGTRTVETGLNIGRSYPNNDFVLLAAVDASGKVLAASGSRGSSPTNWLRPNTSHHTSFPAASDSQTGCDVRNLEYGPGLLRANGTYSMYDSMWMDIGFPVLTTADGRKFKPLFAPLILSLDNKVNLLVAGNRMANGSGGYSHRSHYGLGRYEISLDKIFSAGNTGAIDKLFRGVPNPNSYSRYGPNANSDPDGTPASLYASPYAPIDFDNAATAADPIPKLPGTTGGPANSIYPTFPTTYKSGTVTPAAGHPAGYSYSVKLGDDVNRIPISNMEPLLRYGGTNSAGFTSQFTQILGTDWHKLDKRMLVTLLSNSLDRPLWMPMSDPAMKYEMASGDPYPKLTKKPSFQPGATSIPPLRLNLNRPLTDYPAPDATTGVYKSADMNQVNQACVDRRELAKDIYERLCDATGALKNPGDLPSTDPKYPQYLASRYLAQLAVNIVDYIDKDENITTFAWNPGKTSDLVFGTEMPKLVVNEFYASLDNDKNDPELQDTVTNKKATRYHLRFWTELYNPTKDNVKLFRDGEAAYQLVIAETTGTSLLDDPLAAGITKILTINDWDVPPDSTMPMNLKDKVHAGDKRIDNASGDFYYVVGPKGDFLQSRDPGLPRTLISNKSFKKFENDLDKIHDQIPKEVDVVLQRLANPYLKANPDPADINNGSNPYNPYITIDYMRKIALKDGDDKTVNDNREYDHAAILANPKDLKDFKSVGRRQPYRAGVLEDQLASLPAPTDKPQHTLGQQNSKKLKDTADNIDKINKLDYDAAMGDPQHAPIQWLIHLDRPLLHLFELKHVSALPPHLLTQKFFNGRTPQQHTAPWDQQDSMLYRAFELLAIPDPMVNNPMNGQVAGKININEVWDKETLRALFDAQPGISSFTDADVDAIFNALQAYRENGVVPNANSRPLTGFGAGVYDAAGPASPVQGAASTIFSVNGGNAGLLKSHGSHPYFKDEMLAKLLNNVTFTSNTFAVWVTVGFFEVTDPNAVPPRLGAEIGRADNRHVRHRFFAIIDRTETLLFKGKSTQAISPGRDVTIKYDLDTPQGNPVQPKAASGGVQQSTFVPQVGMLVEIGVDRSDVAAADSREVVVIKSVNTSNGTFVVENVQYAHPANSPLLVRGNPGPWSRYDPRKDSAVVPYFNIIE